MNDKWLVGVHPQDFEGYSMGSPRSVVGPFDSREDAEQWLKDHPDYQKMKFGYDAILVYSAFAGVVHPDDWSLPAYARNRV